MRDAVGEGCNNEGLRVFSPVGNDEEQVNGLTETDPAAAALLKGALQRLSQCVVLLPDRCAESAEVSFSPYTLTLSPTLTLTPTLTQTLTLTPTLTPTLTR